jgi:small acid-soluble spore protein H (minor)
MLNVKYYNRIIYSSNVYKRGGISMDTKRAKEILDNTGDTIEVLYEGSQVWLENITDNNTAVVSYIENHRKEEVPVYKLIENSPAK